MEKGFTLVELLAILVIISIMALITVPTVSGIVERSKKKAYIASMKELIKVADGYYADIGYKNKECVAVTTLDFDDKGEGITGQVCYQDGVIVLNNVTNTKFTANGSADNIVITE